MPGTGNLPFFDLHKSLLLHSPTLLFALYTKPDFCKATKKIKKLIPRAHQDYILSPGVVEKGFYEENVIDFKVFIVMGNKSAYF